MHKNLNSTLKSIFRKLRSSNEKMHYNYKMNNLQLIFYNLILFSYTDHLDQKVYINLMSFDIQNETYEFLDSHFIGTLRSYQMFYDQSDSTRFLLAVNEGLHVRGSIGQVIDNRIRLSERIIVWVFKYKEN